MDDKTCNRCGQTQPITEFRVTLRMKDGHRNQCRSCVKRYDAERYAADPDATRKKNHDRYWSNIEASRDKARRWILAHRDRHTEAAKRWNQANPDRVRASNERRKVRHPDRHKGRYHDNRDRQIAKSLARYARKRGADVCDLALAEWNDIKASYGYRCAYCYREVERPIQDHIVPLVSGGNHTAINIVPACLSCNTSKGARSLLTFLWSRS